VGCERIENASMMIPDDGMERISNSVFIMHVVDRKYI
jgi:hypothetical protein